MRLATLETPDGRVAAVVDDGSARPVAGYSDVGALLAGGEPALAAARAAADDAPARYEAAELRLPVASPGAIVCVGLNYRAHIIEMGRELPTAPTLFAKLPRALADPCDAVRIPAGATTTDYEGELVVVVGKAGRDIPLEEAHRHVAGYTLMNDVSIRALQYRTLQWFAGKNLERSTPVGPLIVTPDELDLGTAEIVVSVNGEVRQQAALSDLVFPPEQLIADLSRIMTLQPGDLIATGTPGGVGHGMEPPVYLGDGDVVTVTVEPIGTLETRFLAA